MSASRPVKAVPNLSWEEHERQHDGRLTAADQAIEEAAFAHVIGRPRTLHLLPATAEIPEADLHQ